MRMRYTVLALCVLMLAWLDPYRDRVKEGNKEFSDKAFRRAEENYKAADKYAPNKKEKKKLEFNLGDARYMSEDYDRAIDNFKASLESGDKDVQKKALFNMGNAYYKKGDMENAINSYINALKIDPNYEPAKKNLEYIIQEKDKNKDNKGSNKDDKKNGKNDKDKQQNRSGNNKQDDQKNNQGRDMKNVDQMNKEQIKNILKSMQDKPVRREKGKGNGSRVLEKSW